MQPTKCFFGLCLCLFVASCSQEHDGLDIDLGDYEYHLEEWNNQNMLDYQINIVLSEPGYVQEALITVRGGIPESSDPPEYLTSGHYESTIPEFYSWFEKVKNYDPDTHSGSFMVSYNTEYHYPKEIIIINGYSHNKTRWQITVMPLEEGELDIDIGDYETHLEAWNIQNVLDYQLEVMTTRGQYDFYNSWMGEVFNVKNGVPDDMFPISELRLTEGTVPGIYSLIKEEETRIRNAYNGIERSSLHVQYNTEYHYPVEIRSSIGHRFGYYQYWVITLTPEETE